MNRGDTITENDLLAYVDGQLTPERRRAVEAYLAGHPEHAAEIAAWRRQNDALSELYRGIGTEPVPDRLSVHGLAAAVPPARIAGWTKLAAAMLLVLGLGGAGGWLARDLASPAAAGPPALVDEAVAAHALFAGEVVHPVEVRAADEAHLRAWLSKRLARPLNVPDLRSRGFELVGGRLLPAGMSPAAQFMYQDRSGARVTLYIVPASDARETNFRFAALDSLKAFFWSDETIRCALVGDLPRQTLQSLATEAYRQLG